MSIEIERFTLDHHRKMFGDEKTSTGIINLVSGPGFALVDGDVLLAIGGVRCEGVGAAWAHLSPEGMHKPKAVLETARAVMADCISTQKLYRIYAEATVDKPAWFKHLGFAQQPNLYVRYA